MPWRFCHTYIQGSNCNFQQQLCRKRHWQLIPALLFYKYQVKSRHTLHDAGHLEATISHAVSQIHARTWFGQTENDRRSEHCQPRTRDFRLQILVFSVPNISSNWHGIPPPHTKIVPPHLQTFKTAITMPGQHSLPVSSYAASEWISPTLEYPRHISGCEMRFVPCSPVCTSHSHTWATDSTGRWREKQLSTWRPLLSPTSTD